MIEGYSDPVNRSPVRGRWGGSPLYGLCWYARSQREKVLGSGPQSPPIFTVSNEDWVAGVSHTSNFEPTSTQLVIKWLKFFFLLPRRKKDNIVRTMKLNHPKNVCFSFFYPLKVTGELEIESLSWVHRGELAMGRNWYHSLPLTILMGS